MANPTFLKVIQQACGEMTLTIPQVALTSSDPGVIQLCYLLTAVCDDLLKEHNWQMLDTSYTLTTVNGTASYSLPADFYRLIDGTVMDQTNHWPLRGPKTPQEWQWIKAGLVNGGPLERWRIQGNKVQFVPTPSTALTIALEYASAYYVIDGNSGNPKAAATQDSDFLMFDNRLLVYGLKLKYRESKGLDTTAYLVDFQRALVNTLGSDEPAPVLNAAPSDQAWYISGQNVPDGGWTT